MTMNRIITTVAKRNAAHQKNRQNFVFISASKDTTAHLYDTDTLECLKYSPSLEKYYETKKSCFKQISRRCHVECKTCTNDDELTACKQTAAFSYV